MRSGKDETSLLPHVNEIDDISRLIEGGHRAEAFARIRAAFHPEIGLDRLHALSQVLDELGDFPVSAPGVRVALCGNATLAYVSDALRFQAIKEGSAKALDAFISRIAMRGVKL